MPCAALPGLVLMLVTVAAPVSGALKVWGHQLSLDSAAAWSGGQLPCADQTVLLSDPLAVYLNQQLEARSMVLPGNGEVIFGEGASISFSDGAPSADGSCSSADGSTVLFGGGEGARWFDADSWHQAALPSPVPHSERVPCSNGGDSVLFPENITYRARVQRPVTVTALTVGPHMMDNERFGAFRRTNIGRSLFEVQATFNISGAGRTCGDEECRCDNDRPEVLSVICAATRCQEAPCSDPIQPAGHCCPMCGAFVRVSPTGSMRLSSTLRRLVGQLSGAAPVRWHVSVTHDRRLQVVLVDTAAERAESARIAGRLVTRLSAQPGMSEPEMKASGPRHAALSGGGGGGGRSAAGPVLGVLVIVILAGLLVWAVRTKRVSLPDRSSVRLPPPPSQWHLADRAAALAGQLPAVRRRIASAATAPFHFARFRNSTCGSEVELGHRVEELESVQDSASDHTAESSEPVAAAAGPSGAPAGTAPPKAARSFNNPLFGNSKLDDHVPPTLLAPTSALCVTPDGKAVANPFFGVPVITAADTDTESAALETAPEGGPPGEPPLPQHGQTEPEPSTADNGAPLEQEPATETGAQLLIEPATETGAQLLIEPATDTGAQLLIEPAQPGTELLIEPAESGTELLIDVQDSD